MDHEQLIIELYENVLSRPVDSEGLHVYTRMLRDGSTIGDIRAILENSDEQMVNIHIEKEQILIPEIIPEIGWHHIPYFNRSLIISRYDEDVSWAFGMKYTLYNKGFELEGGNNLSNNGREGETYLQHIIKYYDTLRDYLICTQGDPFKHNPGFITGLDEPKMKSFQPLSAWWTPDTPPESVRKLTNPNIYTNGVYTHVHMANHDLMCVSPCVWIDKGLNNIVARIKKRHGIDGSIVDWFCKYMDIDTPTTAIPVSMCGMFGVHRERIKQWPVSFYIKLRIFLLEHQDNGYILERMWAFIFSKMEHRTFA